MPIDTYYRYTAQRIVQLAVYPYALMDIPSNIKHVQDDEDFRGQIKYAGDELVVVDFYTTWCGPCRQMEGVVQSLATKYPNVVFLKVDADHCFDTAMQHQVRGVPLFILYRNKEILDKIQGALPNELERKIAAHEAEFVRAKTRLNTGHALYDEDDAQAGTDAAFAQIGALNRGGAPTRGHNANTIAKPVIDDISKYFDLSGCRCINDLAPSSFDMFLGGKKLISGRGSGKVLIVYEFTEKMNLKYFLINARPESAPKVLRFFVNHPKTLDFHVASQIQPSQEVNLCADDLTGERHLVLHDGSFNDVTNLQICVMDAMTPNWKSAGYHRVEIDSLQLFGTPSSPPPENATTSSDSSTTNPFTLESSGSSRHSGAITKNAANFPTFLESFSPAFKDPAELVSNRTAENTAKYLGAISQDIQALFQEQTQKSGHHRETRDTDNANVVSSGKVVKSGSKHHSSHDKKKDKVHRGQSQIQSVAGGVGVGVGVGGSGNVNSNLAPAPTKVSKGGSRRSKK